VLSVAFAWRGLLRCFVRLTLVWGMMNRRQLCPGGFVMLGMYVAFLVLYVALAAAADRRAGLRPLVLATLGI